MKKLKIKDAIKNLRIQEMDEKYTFPLRSTLG